MTDYADDERALADPLFGRGDPTAPVALDVVSVPHTDDLLNGLRRIRKGFLAEDVQALIGSLVARLAEAGREINQLRTSPPVGAQIRDLDEAEMLAVVGYEGARIIRSARERATVIQGEARREFDRLLAEGEEYVARAREDAAAVVDGVQAECDAIRQQVEDEIARRQAEAATITADARAEAERLVSEAQKSSEQQVRDASEQVQRMVSSATQESAEIRAEAEAALSKAEMTAVAQIENARAKAASILAEAEDTAERTSTNLSKQAEAQREEIAAERREMLADATARITEIKDRYRTMVAAYEEQQRLLASELAHQRDVVVSYMQQVDQLRSQFFKAYHGVAASVENALGSLTAPVGWSTNLVAKMDEDLKVLTAGHDDGSPALPSSD